MDKRPPIVRVAFFAALLFSLAACRKEPADPTWDVDVAVPLVNASLTIGDLVADSLLSTDADGNVTLLYTSRLFALKLDTVLSAPDTTLDYPYPFNFSLANIAPNTTFPVSNDVTRFDLDQLELRDLYVRSGTTSMAVSSTLGGVIIGHFGLPGATLNGVPFAIDQAIPAGTQSTPSSSFTERALDGYHFDLRGPDHDDVNTLATQFTYTTDPYGPPLDIITNDLLSGSISYKNVVPQYARGYFGTRVIHIAPATTTLDLFENVSGLLDLDQVTTRLKVSNGIGVDARADILYLRSHNSTTNTTVDLQHTIVSSPINLDRALDLGGTFQPAQNTFVLNNGNSNIDLFVENLPSEIGYEMNITLDPLGDVSNGNDFLYYESELSADLEVEIPLTVIATDLSLSKVIDVDLPGTAEAHALRSGTLHFFTSNGFPFSATLSFAIVNTEGAVLSDVGPGGFVSSGALNGENVVQASTDSHVSVDLTPEQVTSLYDAGKLRITATFNTGLPDEHIRILSSYRMDVQVTLEGNYMVNGND